MAARHDVSSTLSTLSTHGSATPTRPTGRARGRRWAMLALGLLAAIIGTACQDGQLPRVSGEAAPELGAAVDLIVLQHLEDKNVPGATVAVTKGGRLVLSKGYGYSDLETKQQMEPGHRTRIGSVSKLPTTIGAMQLVERGDLDLDGYLYGSAATPIWGSDPNGTPGVIHANDAVLQDAGDYLTALVTAAETLGPAPGVPVDPGTTPGYLLQGTKQGNVTEILAWATRIQVRHVLSHTAGFLRSGSIPDAAEMFDKDEEDISYPELHQAMMTGVNGLPLRFEAGTDRSYSNHGFGLMGQLMVEISGGPYEDYMQANVFHPLGLEHVAARDLIGVVGERDATSYAVNDDGEPVPPLAKYQEERTEPTISTATGSWTATAQDMARVMCGIDDTSNHLRLLDRDTVDTMNTVAYPDADPNQPLGWDLRTGSPGLTKDGSTPRGGGARVTKYLPGEFTDEEINVVVNTNKEGSPSVGLLRSIAKVVAETDITDDYDLFDPTHRCVGPPPTVTITQPGTGAEFRHDEEILLEAIAADFTGEALPVTWHLPDGTDVEATPSPWDGRVSLFTDELPVGTHTVVVSTTDTGGFTASDQVTIEVTYAPPTVSIVTPKDGTTVPAGTDIALVGQSTMGTHFTLPDDQVAWEVERGAQVVHAGTGHHVVVPADVVQPGSYTITFTGQDGVETVGQTVSVVATPAPGGPGTPGGPAKPGGPGKPEGRGTPGGPSTPGGPPSQQRAPVVTIQRPTEDAVMATDPAGSAIEVGFTGSATDAEGDPIDGTRFRWSAIKGGEDDAMVLCEGDSFAVDEAGSAPAVLNPQSDCSSFTVELQPNPVIGGAGTLFVIVLEARDAHGAVGQDQRIISVIIPPVS